MIYHKKKMINVSCVNKIMKSIIYYVLKVVNINFVKHVYAQHKPEFLTLKNLNV